MGKYRKRFNEKARSGMLAKQAALKRARNKQFFQEKQEQDNATEDAETPPPPPVEASLINRAEDSNAEILKPVSEEERLARKRALESSLFSVNEKEQKISRAKKKRLDKYIEHQLKREEKKILLEKLAETKMDTSHLSALKDLGKGKLTKKEEMVEALELERQGRGDERTREILYEPREAHIMDDVPGENKEMINHNNYEDDAQDKEEFSPKDRPSSTFVDFRPAKFGGAGSGFGFKNIPVIKRDTEASKKKYNWRKKLDLEKNKFVKQEDLDDFASSEEDEEEEEESEEGEDEPSVGDNDEDEDEEEESEEESGEESDEEEEEGEEDDDDDDEEEPEQSKLMKSKPGLSTIASSFKEWAEQQIRVAEGRENIPLRPEVSQEVKQKYSTPQVREGDVERLSDEEGYIPIQEDLKRDAFVVNVHRSQDIQNERSSLPVFAEEHKIMEAVYHHDCIILCGETGSGKTTQVPQFLYEAGFGNKGNKLYPGMIGVTQPRRVAAVSIARRVANELGDHGYRVGYQIRFDATIKDEGSENGTALKFMTDGVLLREMMTDFLLTKYSAIVIDEAHERNINTDILLGMLTRVLKLRRKYHTQEPAKYKPLKLIIMSATLRVSDFSENSTLFAKPPPIIDVQARQYPVSVHFNKKTQFDYVDEAFKKACKIHKKLPPGGILIFMTGQSEITTLVRRLRNEFAPKEDHTSADDASSIEWSENIQQEVEDVEFSVDMTGEQLQDDYGEEEEEEQEEEEGFEEAQEVKDSEVGPLHVLPLYSLLPTKQQMRVFQDPPANSRLCVVATNVAETSLTIPGIRYVIDCGRSKEKKYNEENGVQSFEVDWISKASANQRAGRAGRTGPGHCYRLFSSAVFEEFFPQFSVPEILRTPFESIVLSMKSMGIDHIANFPFPTPPDRKALQSAERLLVMLGALDGDQKQITELGRKMSWFPLSPRFAKILIIGNQQECLRYIIAIVSALSAGDPFIPENELTVDMANDEERKQFRSKYFSSRASLSKLDAASECMMLLSAVCALDHIPKEKAGDFISKNYLRTKVVEEIQKLRKQLTHIVEKCLRLPADDKLSDQKLPVPTKKQIGAIKQMIASGFVDQTAIRGDLILPDVKVGDKTRVSRIPYCPVLPINTFDDPYIYIHANSLLAQSGEMPSPYIVYQSLSTKGTSGDAEQQQQQKVRMRPLVGITGKQLANVAKNSTLITYSKPLGHPYAPKALSPTKRECYVVPRFGASIGSGGVGWDLPAVKVIQEKKNGSWANV
ncbi:uncharacterized protein LODBEIA_P45350 [Lodderomyces beijingensis]|uniref:RNA helicase n=1 Tax=Lodderomyces beijingensis TaxID=1775926 RepID=A0ABP0ZT74_9ASCO